MDYKDVPLNISYKSVGDAAFRDAMNRLLPYTKLYKRSVGFFSSSALDFIGDGVIALAQNGGKIHLATCPQLNESDVLAIEAGYADREAIQQAFLSDSKKVLLELQDESANLLYQLVKENILDIKIIIKDGGIYHDKLAVLEDFHGNSIVCVGSNNESEGGYSSNYEKVRLYKSWTDVDGRVEDETKEFETIWNDENDELQVFDFTEALERELIQRVNHQGSYQKPKTPKYKMRDYQIQAKETWIKNGHKGFFIMATGTGKTITSLNAFKEFVTDNKIFTVIAVPYKHLVSQWTEDAKEFFPEANIIQVHGEITDAETRIFSCYQRSLKNYKPIIVITTIKSFFLDKYKNLYNKIKYEKLLVVDEAHNFINSINDELSEKYPYKLGLSATPVFGKDETKTKLLIDWFGGVAADFPIEKAIGKYLVEYEYHPIFVDATEKDEKNFAYYTQQMMYAFDQKTGAIIDQDRFTRAYRNRLKTISMAENKINNISSIFGHLQETSHVIIYCSDGRLFYKDNKTNEEDEIRHLEYMLKLINRDVLTKYPTAKASKFTASEAITTRLELIEDFNKERINYLVAIRCLDEGINIPSIKAALILSSNDNYREFVQRRGRILRQYTDPDTKEEKKLASIYDVIVLPSTDNKSFAEIELRRFYEYSRLAKNKDKLLNQLQKLLIRYDMEIEDIMFKNEFVYGGDLDD